MTRGKQEGTGTQPACWPYLQVHRPFPENSLGRIWRAASHGRQLRGPSQPAGASLPRPGRPSPLLPTPSQAGRQGFGTGNRSWGVEGGLSEVVVVSLVVPSKGQAWVVSPHQTRQPAPSASAPAPAWVQVSGWLPPGTCTSLMERDPEDAQDGV